MTDSSENREMIRLPFTPRAYCQLKESGKEFTGTIRDISVLSLFLELETEDDLSGECDIQIVLEGEHSEMEINNLSGYVIRSDKDGLAIRFEQPFEWFATVPTLFNTVLRPGIKK